MLIMGKKFTELEKTILLTLLAISKEKQIIKQSEIILKFPKSQRKIAKYYLENLISSKNILRVGKNSYILSDLGKRNAMKILIAGGKIQK